MSTIAHNQYWKTQLVKHVFRGNVPLYELQVYSNDKKQWYMVHSTISLGHLKLWAFHHCYPVPDEMIICDNHGDNN